MTQDEHIQLKKDVLYDVQTAEDVVTEYRQKLTIIGKALENIGRGFQEHPEEVRRMPDPHTIYDYSEGVKLILGDGDGDTALRMCDDLRYAEQRVKAAKMRAGVFSQKPSGFGQDVD